MKPNQKILLGFIATLVLSTIVLFVFYGELLKSPNTKYFAKGGDGMKSYYVGTYHIKYDSTYLVSQAMNYPYGESAFFTDCHPLVSNTLKFISNNIVDVSDYFPGAINLLMLISLIIASLFMFLIFTELGLPALYSVFPAIAIVFLSPQIDRMGGHFSFSYHFVLPLMIYLMLRFYKVQRIRTSIFISLLLFFGLTSHQYLFAFCSVFLLSLWLFMASTRKIKLSAGSIHFSLQFLLPLIVYSIFLVISTSVTDRTTHPWGFLYYRAYPESVFLPLNRGYGRPIYNLFSSLNYIDWEGYAYIGIVAVIGFLFFLKRTITKIIQKKYLDVFILTDNKVLNLFFWASLLTLLYSFGIPYILGMEFLLDYIGVLRQMRGIARFAWLFYYMMNILAFYWIWKWLEGRANIIFKVLVVTISFGVIIYEAYNFNNGRQYLYNNEVPELSKDYQPQWLRSIEKDKYQAIIPIPYFNVGSENLWIDNAECTCTGSTFMLSQKTGLPTNGVMLSRTSIGQSYNNIALSEEPYRKPAVLKDCKSTQPFLLLVKNCTDRSEAENYFIKHSAFVDSSETFKLYEISYDQLLTATDTVYNEVKNDLDNLNLFRQGGFLSSANRLDFAINNYDTLASADTYNGSGAFEGGMVRYNTIFDDTLPNCNPEDEYLVSFWYGKMLNDVQVRATLILGYYDENGNNIREDWSGLMAHVKIIDGNWALFEVKFKMPNPRGKFKVTLRNDQLHKGTMLVDELLIRPLNTNVYKVSGDILYKNNRFYMPKGN